MNMMTSILFICHGNICRSPMAEFYMKHLVSGHGCADMFHIASAATSREEIGNDIHWGTKEKLRDEGIPFARRGAVQLCREDYEAYDYLVYFDEENKHEIRRIAGEDTAHKVYALLSFAGITRDVADPWYTGNFDATYADVEMGCQAFWEFLQRRRQVLP